MKTIGVLDSGIGGLTTCYEILKQIQNVNIIYFADNKNAPYGSKTDDEVSACVTDAVKYLLSYKLAAIVIACNTATATSIANLRKQYDVSFIGIEPYVKGVKNACGNTLYLATDLTKNIKREFDFIYADTGLLAPLIEAFCNDGNTLEKITVNTILPHIDKVENVILGCTHYPFLTPYINKNYPQITVFDGNGGVARQTRRIVKVQPSTRCGRILFKFSGEREYNKYLRAFRALYDIK